MSKILVTGADGFIGSHVVEHLVRLGHEVRAFVLYNSFNSWGWLDSCAPDVVGKFEAFAGDIRDPNGVRVAMQDCDVVLHLAALIGIPYSYHSPDTYIDTNIKGTLNVLQAGRDLGVDQIIHTSTSEVYGSAQYVPITELHPLEGQSPYSASKIGADQMALAFHRSFDTPVTIMRPFNTYGPRQSARAVIPTVITQLAVGDGSIRLGSVQRPEFRFIEAHNPNFIFQPVGNIDEHVRVKSIIPTNRRVSLGECFVRENSFDSRVAKPLCACGNRVENNTVVGVRISPKRDKDFLRLKILHDLGNSSD